MLFKTCFIIAVAALTGRIQNFKEHIQKHPKVSSLQKPIKHKVLRIR